MKPKLLINRTVRGKNTKLIMQKNLGQTAGVGAGTDVGSGYQYPPEAQAQAQPHPQPPSYEQATHFQMPATAQVVIIQQQPPPAVGPNPCFISCPHCHVQKLTRVEYAPSVRTHCMAALLCIVGLWCFACLPYCATSCMSANHFCGNCNKFVGVYSSD